MKTRRSVSGKDKEHERPTDRRLSPRKKRKVEFNTEDASHENNGSDIEKEHEQSNVEYGQHELLVTCGNKRGMLSVEKLKMGQDCIDCEGHMFSPSTFENHAGKENDHKDELNPDDEAEKTNKELANVQNGKGAKRTVLRKKAKLVLKKLPEEAEVQPEEEDMHIEDTTTDADNTSEAQDNSEDTDDKEADASSPKDNQNEPSPTHERPPQSHSPSPIKDTPASTLLSSSELDMTPFEQLKSHEEGEPNSSWSVPKEAEVQHAEEDMHVDTISNNADKTSEAQDNCEETEDKEADTSSPKDNENEKCEVETVPSPTHELSPVEDVSMDVTDPDPAEQMPMERPVQSRSPSPVKDTPAPTLPSSSEPDKMDIEQQKSLEEDEHNRTNAIITDIKRTMLKKTPKLVLKKLPRHMLDRSHLQSSKALLNGKTTSEEVQNLEEDKNHDSAECEVQNAAVPSTAPVQSPTEDTSPDLTDPEPAQQNHIESPLQSHSPSLITDTPASTLPSSSELDVMDIEQQKCHEEDTHNSKTNTEEVQNLEEDQNHDSAECDVQNAAVPSLAPVQSPTKDTSPDLTDPEPAQQKLIERPPQSHSPSSTKDALIPTPLTDTEQDTMDLEQLKREKIKLQLRVLKLQEQYYTLQLQKLKE